MPSMLVGLRDISHIEDAEQQRRDFVANVSHELRTPLTIIKGFAETLVEDHATLPVETRARFLDKIVNNAQRLHVLVEDLLELSRLESQSEQIQSSVQSLQQLLEEMLEPYRLRLNSEEQVLKLEFDERIGEFVFDPFRIQQVFDNLIENGFRYAPDFTLLAVSVRYDDANDLIQCTVADDGPGIPAKDAPHVFERFYRVDSSRTGHIGLGIGLTLVKSIIEKHQGTIQLKNSDIGTTFIITLPFININLK